MTTASSESVLQLVAVRKTYPATPPVEPLRGIDLTVARGELVAIVGPSGSGKSTLLNLMAGLDRPTSGTVRIGGQDVTGLSDRQMAGLRAHRLGVVFQQFFLLDSVTALGNVANGLLYRAVPARQRRAAARDALEQVGLAHRASQVCGKLSGGERQRVAIARALVADPAVVLADEPTGNLDSTNAAAVLELLRQLNRQGTTLIVVTHDRDVADAMHRRIELRDGLIVGDHLRQGATP